MKKWEDCAYLETHHIQKYKLHKTFYLCMKTLDDDGFADLCCKEKCNQLDGDVE